MVCVSWPGYSSYLKKKKKKMSGIIIKILADLVADFFYLRFIEHKKACDAN